MWPSITPLISHFWHGNTNPVQEKPAIKIDDSTHSEYVLVEKTAEPVDEKWVTVTCSNALKACEEANQQAWKKVNQLNDQRKVIVETQGYLVQGFKDRMEIFKAQYSAEDADMTEFFSDLKSLFLTFGTMFKRNMQLDQELNALKTDHGQLLKFIKESTSEKFNMKVKLAMEESAEIEAPSSFTANLRAQMLQANTSSPTSQPSVSSTHSYA